MRSGCYGAAGGGGGLLYIILILSLFILFAVRSGVVGASVSMVDFPDVRSCAGVASSDLWGRVRSTLPCTVPKPWSFGCCVLRTAY